MNTRIETDLLGEKAIPTDALWGIHTARAVENFPLSGIKVHPELIKAYGEVKLACTQINRQLNVWNDEKKAEAIEKACREVSQGLLNEHFPVDALQGGAGTSLNMNVNEVIANRALQILGENPGNYNLVSPLDDVNRHQSTNDTYPTALKIAAIRLIRELGTACFEFTGNISAERERVCAHRKNWKNSTSGCRFNNAGTGNERLRRSF